MNYIVSKIISQDGSPFIEASDGSIEFGFITSEQNLHPAPIRLVLGNEDNGLIHIIKRYGNKKENIWSASELQNEEPASSNTSQPATNADKEASSNGTVSDVSFKSSIDNYHFDDAKINTFPETEQN